MWLPGHVALLSQDLQFCGMVQVLTPLWASVSSTAVKKLDLWILTMPLPSIRPGSAVHVSVLQACTCPFAPSLLTAAQTREEASFPFHRQEPRPREGTDSPGHTACQGGVSEPVGAGGPLYFLGLRGVTQQAHLQTVLTAVACTHVGTRNTDVNTQILRHTDTSVHTHELAHLVGIGGCCSWELLPRLPDALPFYKHFLRVWRKGEPPILFVGI